MSTHRSYRLAGGRSKGFRCRPTAPALGGADSMEALSCDKQAIARIAVASAQAVSPAVSPPVSPSNGREQLKAETLGSKRGNQSGCQPRNTKPNCYACKHRRDLVGDAHSECAHPKINPSDRALAPLALISGMDAPIFKRMNITCNAYGVRNGWFMWPMNFDPTWLESCDGFEPRGETP